MRAFWPMVSLAGLLCWVPAATAGSAPEFTHAEPGAWINSKPLTLAGLRGQAVVVEFWTFGCGNCLRTLPWLKTVHARYADKGLVVVSVHSPEFDHERDVDKLRAAVKRLDIRHAVMIDNDFSYWRAFGNRYWPAFYLVDREGRVVARAIGELHAGDPRGDGFEQRIQRLLDSG